MTFSDNVSVNDTDFPMVITIAGVPALGENYVAATLQVTRVMHTPLRVVRLPKPGWDSPGPVILLINGPKDWERLVNLLLTEYETNHPAIARDKKWIEARRRFMMSFIANRMNESIQP